MRKHIVVAVLGLAAFAMSVAPASAGWFCHRCCGRLGACATQYNAFSPYCVTGVYTSHHCRRCMHPAEGPCGGAGGSCGVGCEGAISTAPASTASMDSGMLGELPAPVMIGAVPNNQTIVPLAPAPVPSIPGTAAPLVVPTHNIQPLR
jgi:hypothetical protein